MLISLRCKWISLSDNEILVGGRRIMFNNVEGTKKSVAITTAVEHVALRRLEEPSEVKERRDPKQ